MSGHNIPDPSSLSIDDVLNASAANVEGYLRNTARRQRHATAGEGGRGTKVNRVAAVTSADQRTLEAFKRAAARAGPDGRVVVKPEDALPLPTETAVKTEATSAAGAAAGGDDDDDVRIVDPATEKQQQQQPAEATAIDEAAAVDDDDDEDWEAVDLEDDVKPALDAKALLAASTAANDSSDAKAGEFPGVDVTGTRPAADGIALDNLGAGGDPDRHMSLFELRQAAKAQRWVEKNRLFEQCVTAFVLFVGQARTLYKTARHPRLSAALREVPCIREAIDAARQALDDPLAAEARKRDDMAPAWVSHGRDGTGTSTGAASVAIVAGIARFLRYRKPAAEGDGDATATTAAADGSQQTQLPGADAGDENDAAVAAAVAAAAVGDSKEGPKLPHETGDVPVLDVLLKAARRAARAAAPKPAAPKPAAKRATKATKKKKKETPAAAEEEVVEASAPTDTPTVEPAPVPHPAHFAVAFIAAASCAGLRCRLCSAFGTYEVVPRETRVNGADEAFRVKPSDRFGGGGAKPKAAKPGGKKSSKAAAETEAPAKKKPRSPFWVEVWCPVKRMFISVNPCPAVTTIWGSPYVVACGGDHVADVTLRYISAWSKVFKLRIDEMHYTKGFLWPEELAGDSVAAAAAAAGGRVDAPNEDDDGEAKEESDQEKKLPSFACSSTGAKSSEAVPVSRLLPTQRILWPMRQDVAASTVEMLEREAVQLKALQYSEPVPTTITELKGHPLFVTEENITRYEGIYPKTGPSIVGYVRGKPVYRRDCVHQLRSKQGWLRLGLMVDPPDLEPYKLAPPPPSRPLVAHSQFFGRWQTVPFRPAPLNDDGTIPRFESTSWYLLLGHSKPGAGMTHLRQPNVAAAARRMRAEFAVVVTAFVREHAGQERELGQGGGTGNSNNGGRRDRFAEMDAKLGVRRDAANDFRRVHVMRGRWVPKFDGIVVPESAAAAVERAYDEWAMMKEQQERAKRRQRAMRGWRGLIQLALARLRITSDYAAPERPRGGKQRLPKASRADI